VAWMAFTKVADLRLLPTGAKSIPLSRSKFPLENFVRILEKLAAIRLRTRN